MRQELVKPIIKVGNGAGVLLPREWLNGRARIELVEKPLNIKRDVLEILEDYLSEIMGIYLVGSYARGEQNDKSDIDIIAISEKASKEIISGKYHVSIVPLESVKKVLKSNPILIYPRLLEAKSISNGFLVQELLLNKMSRSSLKDEIEAIKRIIKINKDFISLDREIGEKYASEDIVYSLMLRLREMFIIRKILAGKHYSGAEFKKWFGRNAKKINFKEVYDIYQGVKMNYKSKSRIELSAAEQLIELLEEEVKKYG